MKQSESAVTAACRNWLIAHGWRPHRNHCGEFFTRNGQRLFGEPVGTPDWSFSKPTDRGHAKFIYVEMKATKGKLRKSQSERIAILRQKGYTVIVTNSLDDLQDQVRSVYADGHITD